MKAKAHDARIKNVSFPRHVIELSKHSDTVFLRRLYVYCMQLVLRGRTAGRLVGNHGIDEAHDF
jgi:hypothetical protein